MRHTYPEILDMAANPDRPDGYVCGHGMGHPWPGGRFPEDPYPHVCCDVLEHCPCRWARNIWERCERLRLIRDAGRLHADGLTASQVATDLGVSETETRRLIAAAGTLPEEETPEEIILDAALRGADRRALIDLLTGLHYTYGEAAPFPMEGASRGSFDDVEDARFEGLLTVEEFEEVRAAVAAREGIEP